MGRGAVLRRHQGGRQRLGRDSIAPRFYVEEHLGELFSGEEPLDAEQEQRASPPRPKTRATRP
jgi:hypothetical protein